MSSYFSKLGQAILVGVPATAISRGVVLHFKLGEWVDGLFRQVGVGMSADAAGWLLSGLGGIGCILAWFLFELGARLRQLGRNLFQHNGAPVPPEFSTQALPEMGPDIVEGACGDPEPILTKRTDPPIKRDMPIRDVVAWIRGSNAMTEDVEGVQRLFDAIRDKARCSELNVWSRPTTTWGIHNTGAMEPIEPIHWRDYGMQNYHYAEDDQGRTESDTSIAGNWYSDLWYCRAQIEREFPLGSELHVPR